MDMEHSPQTFDVDGGIFSPHVNEASRTYSISRCDVDEEASLTTCRVCQCAESDEKGDAALGFLGIIAPRHDGHKSSEDIKPDCKIVSKDRENESHTINGPKVPALVEFISPNGEVFVCHTNMETGFDHNQDTLVELGCACKNDLALVHYACALKWFVNRGSTVCEICGCVTKNIRMNDFKKVMSCLKEYEALRERTESGEPNPAQLQVNSGVDPDAVAAIRRQRLSEISLWFSPHNASNSATVPQFLNYQPSTSSSNIVMEEVVPPENYATKWAVEGTGILLATGLLTVTLAWLIAPHVGKKTAKNGLHILLGGLCALTVVVCFRFFVLTRIKYGPARYWAILFVFWFLVFGIWASRTHNAHAT